MSGSTGEGFAYEGLTLRKGVDERKAATGEVQYRSLPLFNIVLCAYNPPLHQLANAYTPHTGDLDG
jgi:hypothetical protein